MQAFPFTSKIEYDDDGNIQYDRAVDSIILRNLIRQYVTNGVFPNPSTNFQVVASGNDDMTVKVQPGSCVINGTTAYEIDERELVVQAADAIDRIDTVVLRLDDHMDARSIDLYVIQGTPASTPTAPALTRMQDVYELGIANLYIRGNSTRIPQERITDTRLDENRCGYAGFMTEIDTQSFYDQIQAELDYFKNDFEAASETWKQGFEGRVEAWRQAFESELATWKQTFESNAETWEQNFESGSTAWRQNFESEVTTWKNGIETDTESWEQSFENAVRTWFTNLRTHIDEDDVVAINDRLDNIERHYAIGEGIELKIAYVNHSPALQIVFDDELWTDPAI